MTMTTLLAVPITFTNARKMQEQADNETDSPQKTGYLSSLAEMSKEAINMQ
jgi:hypothetical protein